VSCGNGRTDEYSEDDLRKDLGITIAFPDLNKSNSDSDSSADSFINDLIKENEDESIFKMKVYDSMSIYSSLIDDKAEKILGAGEFVLLQELNNSEWANVYSLDGKFMGYAKDGFMHSISTGSEVYAELPIEYGKAKTNSNTYVDAYSHLVDIRKYFKVYSSTDELEGATDYSNYDLVVSMKLSTEETSIGEPFYDSNICMVQYDILPMLKKAIELFRKDGYILVIYDAYRPTSVQQRWFDVVKVHKWVADPSIGMGGIHDRGSAVDISLIDINGRELGFPTPMHTFTEDSARHSPNMTETARAIMNYMLDVMVQCGFTYINSEWWHFQDVNTQYYLPTDHPLDKIPLVPSEPTELDTIKKQ
jgi:D-alanyl-D-alanine dipeptidase